MNNRLGLAMDLMFSSEDNPGSDSVLLDFGGMEGGAERIKSQKLFFFMSVHR